MSLVLDSLKKIKRSTQKGSVPPGLVNLAPRRRGGRPNKTLLLLLGLAAAGFAVVFFLDDSGRQYKVTPPAQTAAGSFSEKSAEVSAPAPKPNVSAQQQTDPAENPSQDDFQAKLDAAVQDALKKSDANLEAKINRITSVNSQRLAALENLPQPAQQKIIEEESAQDMKTASASIEEKGAETITESKEMLENLPGNDGGGAQTSGAYPAESVQTPRPVMSEEQRAEFSKKIIYNNTVAQAEKALNSGRYSKAAELFQEAISQKKSSANLANLLLAYVRMGDTARVYEMSKKYSSFLTKDAVSAAAIEMSKLGQHTQGLSYLKSMLGHFDNDAVIYYTAGIINEMDKNNEKAEAAYQKAVELAPVEPYYIYGFARILDINKKYAQAAAEYSKIQPLVAEPELKKNASERANTLRDYIERVKKENDSEIRPAS